VPWLVNLASLPFVLIFGAIVGEVALRKLTGGTETTNQAPDRASRTCAS
jgi:hypothetical protein